MVAKILVGLAAALLATGAGVFVAFSDAPTVTCQQAADSTPSHSPCCSAPMPCGDAGESACCVEASAGSTDALAACTGAAAYGTAKPAAKGKTCCAE